jgi:hypothetical protein
MRKYDELYTAIKNNRKKSATTFNHELLKMILSQQKKESGQGTKKLFDQKGKNAQTDAWMSSKTMLMMRIIMHQFVFSFELGWLLRFTLICPQNIRRCPKNNDSKQL